MGVIVDEPVSLPDIDEALAHIVDTMRKTNNCENLMAIVDALLDARLECQ